MPYELTLYTGTSAHKEATNLKSQAVAVGTAEDKYGEGVQVRWEQGLGKNDLVGHFWNPEKGKFCEWWVHQY